MSFDISCLCSCIFNESSVIGRKYVGMTSFYSVADRGFDLGVDLCQRRGGGRTLLKVLTVEV